MWPWVGKDLFNNTKNTNHKRLIHWTSVKLIISVYQKTLLIELKDTIQKHICNTNNKSKHNETEGKYSAMYNLKQEGFA